MKKNVMNFILSLAVSAALFVLDLLSKIWAVNTLKGQEDIVLIKGVFSLHYLENRGMAFGLMQNQQLFFYIITGIILAAGLYILFKTPGVKRYALIRICLVLIMAGAVGNLVDRVSKRYVVDFLYFSLIDFPVFNVADSYVTVGCILALILMIFVYKDEELKVYGFKRTSVGKKETGDFPFADQKKEDIEVPYDKLPEEERTQNFHDALSEEENKD